MVISAFNIRLNNHPIISPSNLPNPLRLFIRKTPDLYITISNPKRGTKKSLTRDGQKKDKVKRQLIIDFNQVIMVSGIGMILLMELQNQVLREK